MTLHVLSLSQQRRTRTTRRVQSDHAVERSAEKENDDRAEPEKRAERDRRFTRRGSAACDENEAEDTCGKRSECQCRQNCGSEHCAEQQRELDISHPEARRVEEARPGEERRSAERCPKHDEPVLGEEDQLRGEDDCRRGQDDPVREQVPVDVDRRENDEDDAREGIDQPAGAEARLCDCGDREERGDGLEHVGDITVGSFYDLESDDGVGSRR